ncbi:hypothetical protein EVAR_35973_1 [Eumeta japonica]|uniref:Uncharacterized protein n=1 Tax=Eumeta variegata TaxID=151549 RepID=A0A4C1W6B7_EUMVA|nr:hypothetical protein EVAR_35973_1 [Eumeta japonica]
MKTDRHVNYHEIWASLSISMSQIQSILHKNLDIKKAVLVVNPTHLTEVQKTDRVDRYNAMLSRLKKKAPNLVYFQCALHIIQRLKRMKAGIAAGYDRVLLEMLRGGGGIVARLLYQLLLYQLCTYIDLKNAYKKKK